MTEENNLGAEVLIRTRINERKRESNLQEQRQEAYDLEALQQEKARKDKNKPILRN